MTGMPRMLLLGGLIAVLSACGAQGPQVVSGGAAPYEGEATPTAGKTPGATTPSQGTPQGGQTPSPGDDGSPDDDPAPGRCSTSVLRGSTGAADPAAGSVYTTLTLTNTAGKPCTVQGYPGVAFTGGDADRVSGPGGKIVLKPGAGARATLKWPNMPADGRRIACPEIAELRVIPPDETVALTVAFGRRVCDRKMTVTPLTQ